MVIKKYGEYGMPSQLTLRASDVGFICSLQQKGKSFNAKRINEDRIVGLGGAAFSGYRRTNGTIFFDDPFDTHEVFFMYLCNPK